MSRIVFVNGLNFWRQTAGAVLLAGVVLLAGCQTAPNESLSRSAKAVDIDGEMALARKLPILILVAEPGSSRADDDAAAWFGKLMVKQKNEAAFALLDLSVSRNRAEAARFHVTNTPLLLSLTAGGLIVTRDDKAVTADLVGRRIAEVAQRGPGLETKLAALEEAAARNGNAAAAQLELAEFLLAQQNAREAIPHLEAVAHDEAADTTSRVRAWVALVRAHFWITEPEKGRHEANDLIAILGPKTAEARAGGNLVLGMQDANAKRMTLAWRELEAAVAAAPESDYGKQAAAALAKLPGEGK
jgi:hypothetical protein